MQPVLIVHCRAKAGAEEALAAACVANATASGREPGVLRFDVLRDDADPAAITLYEVYRDPEAVARHKETAHYARWVEEAEPLLEGPRTRERLVALHVPPLGAAGS